jgi:hypothetical protein
LKARFAKLLWALVIALIISMMFSHVSVRSGARAAWDIPPTRRPIVVFDLYTQRCGIGSSMPGGQFEAGENVTLYAKMTANNSPLEGRMIMFEITGPTNPHQNISFLLNAVTDSSGIASQTLMIQPAGQSQATVLGTWTVTAQIGIDQETYGDSLDFQVAPDLSTMTPEFQTWTMPLILFILAAAVALANKHAQTRPN